MFTPADLTYYWGVTVMNCLKKLNRLNRVFQGVMAHHLTLHAITHSKFSFQQTR